jgi:hypothetical protein
MFYSREQTKSNQIVSFQIIRRLFFHAIWRGLLSERSGLLLDSAVAAKLLRVLTKQRSPSIGILRFPRPNAPRIPPRTTLRTSDVFISTVGQLHEAVQSLGPLAWFEFQRAYHEAAGIKPKRKQTLVCSRTCR